jgi:hypothetical protein
MTCACVPWQAPHLALDPHGDRLGSKGQLALELGTNGQLFSCFRREGAPHPTPIYKPLASTPSRTLTSSIMGLEIDRYAIAAELFPTQPEGFPLPNGDFDLGEVRLPSDDDLDIPSDDGADAEDDLQSESGFGSVLGAWGCMRRLHLAWALAWPPCIRPHAHPSPLPPCGHVQSWATSPWCRPRSTRSCWASSRKFTARSAPCGKVGHCGALRASSIQSGRCVRGHQPHCADPGAGGIHMPMDEATKMSKGFVFIEFATPQVGPWVHSMAASSTAASVCAPRRAHPRPLRV